MSLHTFVEGYQRRFIVLLFLWMYLSCDAIVPNSFEDFEDNTKEYHTWATSYGSYFIVVNGSRGTIPGAPKVDATLGTAKGKYCITSYNSPADTSWLFSTCFLPSNPNCTIQFSGYINIQEDEDFHLCAMKQCDLCQPIQYSDCFIKHSFNRTDNWTEIDFRIGYSPTPFDISFGATLHSPGSFVALDDISVFNCHTEDKEPDVCGPDDVSRCDYTKTCIARDQMCDLYSDCPCGEDEFHCDIIPPEGYLNLTDCNLEDGSCLWYNARERTNVDEVDAGNGDEGNQSSDQLMAADAGDESNRPNGWEINRNNGSSPINTGLPLDDVPFEHGPFMYVDVPSFPKAAVLRSVSLKPKYIGDGLCQIRFHYRITSDNASLELMLLETGKGVKDGVVRSRTLWKQQGIQSKASDIAGSWIRKVIDLNEAPINVSYVLQFRVTSQPGGTGGRVYIHSLTLGEECFSPDITLGTCGFDGPKGPLQEMCDSDYRPELNINVISSGHETGVQTWTVPTTQAYRIHAFGARGGWGLHAKTHMKNTRGSKVTATFRLHAGSKVYFLIGQAGAEACPELAWSEMPEFCRKRLFDGTKGGGGGGGGATIVYQRESKNTIKILLVAGGGGGLPYAFDEAGMYWNPENADRITNQHTGTPIPETTHAVMMDESEAAALFDHPLHGGKGCSLSTKYWGGSGGFGGGGGACTQGGHGGGADVSASQDQSNVGSSGRSFVHPDALEWHVEIDSHGSHGIADVESLWFCPCAYRCMWKGPDFKKPVCLCPQGRDLKDDGSTCEELPEPLIEPEQESRITVIILATFIVFAIAFSLFTVCAYMRRSNNRTGFPIRTNKTIQILCPCLNLSGRPLTFNSHVLPQITNPPAVMHENSIYNRVNTKTSDQVLNEIPRKHLKLVGELGQGAFGEVFYGLLSHMPMVDGDLPVAVKTLPLACTEQTEMDFLLEALIVSKFNHPNIVKYLGNCFDQQPQYLILELLEGGDLRSFLHKARPKREVQSIITANDLLRLSLDISRGCQHLEEKHFIHRDIAARNCLLTTKGPNRIAKIADFGMARDIYRSDYYKKAGRAMLPVKWMPPEAFLDGIFTTKTDVWSYGILLWEVFSLGHMPYLGCSNEEVMNLVTKGGRLEPPAGCPPSVFDIMTSCWATVPETRPNFGLIISVLERTIQDDDTSSHCLPFYYTPPVIHSKRICVKNTNPFPSDSSKGACGHSDQSSTSRHSKLQVKFDNEQGYLEPLISRQTSNSSASKHVFLPT